MLLDHLHAYGGADKVFEVRRWPGRVRAAAHADDVPGDLQGRENNAPRKSPPAEEEREYEAAELAFARATPTHDDRKVAPPGEDGRGPDAIDAMHVHRAGTAAFRALPPMHESDFIDDRRLRDLGSNFQDK